MILPQLNKAMIIFIHLFIYLFIYLFTHEYLPRMRISVIYLQDKIC